jgi:hypothetical protein
VACREGPGCTASCVCSDGWGGSDCSKSSEALIAIQEIRASYLDVMVRDAVWFFCTSSLELAVVCLRW